MSVFKRYIAAGFLCAGLIIFAASPSSAQTNAYNAADTALPSFAVPGGVLAASGARVSTPLAGVPQVLSLQAGQASPLTAGAQAPVSGLAFTGADVVTLLLIAVPFIVLGSALTRHGRPRPQQASQS